MQIYVLFGKEEEEENSLQFFPHTRTHIMLQYILVDGTRVLFAVLLLHLHLFSSFFSLILLLLLLLSSTKLNKGDRAEVFLVVVMAAAVEMAHIVYIYM